MALPCTSNTPTDKTNHLKSSIDRDYQRAATVTLMNIEDESNYIHLLIPYLTTVSSALLISGTEEVLRVDPLLPATLINEC